MDVIIIPDELSKILLKIKRATSKLVCITGERLREDSSFVKQLAKQGKYSYRLFDDLMDWMTEKGKIADFPSIKEQLAAWIYGITSEEQTIGLVIDRFDIALIEEFNLKVRIVQELKNHNLSQKTARKLVIINCGQPLDKTFNQDFLRKCYIITV